MPLRVAIMGFYPFGEGGGPISRDRYFALGLNKAGAEAQIFVFAPEEEGEGFRAGDESFLWQHIPVKTARLAQASPVKRAGLLGRVMTKAIEDRKRRLQIRALLNKFERQVEKAPFDAVIIHNMDLLACLRLWRICRKHGIACIQQYVELHLPSDYKLGVFQPHYLRERLHFVLFPHLSDGDIAISTYLQNACERKTGRKALLVPTLAGIRMESRRSTSKEARTPFRFSYVGPGARREAVLLILQACARLQGSGQSFVLNLAGLGPKKLKHYRKEAYALNIAEKLAATGWIDNQSLHNLYNETDAFLLLRTADRSSLACFPGRLAEFLDCGKLVILTAIGDFPRYFKDMESAVLVPPDDPVSLSDKMARLIAEPSLATKIGEAGRLVGARNFNHELLGKEVFDYVQQCVLNVRSRGKFPARQICDQ